MSCCGWILNGPVILGHPYMLLYLLRHCGAVSNLLLNTSETEESSAGCLLPSKVKQSTEDRRKMTAQRDDLWAGLMRQFLGNYECIEKISVFPHSLMILVAPRHLSGEAPWEPLLSSVGINGNLVLLCDSPALLLQGNCWARVTNQHGPSTCCELADPALLKSRRVRFEELRKGLCVWFRFGISSVTASIGNVPAATGAQAAWFTREVTVLNKSYIRNNLPPAAHNNAAVIPSRRSADTRKCPCEASVSCSSPQASWRDLQPQLVLLHRPPSPRNQQLQRGRHGHAALQHGALRLPAQVVPHASRCGLVGGITPIPPCSRLAGCKSAPARRL